VIFVTTCFTYRHNLAPDKKTHEVSFSVIRNLVFVFSLNICLAEKNAAKQLKQRQDLLHPPPFQLSMIKARQSGTA
jgi:hypothetical protein